MLSHQISVLRNAMLLHFKRICYGNFLPVDLTLKMISGSLDLLLADAMCACVPSLSVLVGYFVKGIGIPWYLMIGTMTAHTLFSEQIDIFV